MDNKPKMRVRETQQTQSEELLAITETSLSKNPLAWKHLMESDGAPKRLQTTDKRSNRTDTSEQASRLREDFVF